MKTLLRILLKCLFRTKLVGFEKLRLDKPTIILPNHVSFLDAVFLFAFLPDDVCYVVNTGVSKKFKLILKVADYVAIDPTSPYSLKKLVKVMKSGRHIVIFPEGRISTTGGLMKIFSGVGFVAMKTGAMLNPVIFLGLEMSKVSRIVDKVKSRWFPQVTMYVGEPVKLNASENKGFKQQKREIGDKLLVLMQNSLFNARQEDNECKNLFDKLLDSERLHGAKKVMAEDINGAVTYRQGIIAGYVLGNKLKPLLRGEETVGVMLPNSIGHVAALYSLFYLAKTPAILNFSAGIGNNIDCAETAGIKTILTSRAFIEKGKLEDYVNKLELKFRVVYLEDVKSKVGRIDKFNGVIKYLNKEKAAKGSTRVILFTSGSESKPKGVVLSHVNIMTNINQISSVIDFTHKDKMLNALPMFHSFGLTAGTFLPIIRGLGLYLYPSPLNYKVIPEIAYEKNATILLGTPTFLAGYAKRAHHYDFYSMRYVIAGGEKLKEDIRKLWLEKFGIRILEGYGATETAPVLSVNTPLFNKAGTVGRFLPGIDWKLEQVEGVQGGNLLVQGSNVMEGYMIYGKGFDKAEEWYNCGDVVDIDSEGFITIKSRLKRFAKISGEMVSLDAVEKAADSCFGIERNAVISVMDEGKGEKIVLFTIEKSAERKALREHFSNTGQSMLMLPSKIIILEKLPLLGNGKIDYMTLKSEFTQIK